MVPNGISIATIEEQHSDVVVSDRA